MSKMLAFAAHTCYQKRFDKYCLLLLWARLKISYVSHYYAVYEIMSVCMSVKQQTDDLYA